MVENTGKPAAAFMTLGCKVNYYETKKLMKQFADNGFGIVEFGEYADVYVVNTCTVTNIADRKSRKMLHRPKKINPDAIVVALGCFAQAQGEKLLSDTDIDVVIGNDRKEEAYDIITGVLKDADTGAGCSDKDRERQMHDPSYERTRAYIKIQDGCNQFCSYCKIPYVRGKLKSYNTTEVVNHIRELVETENYKEVVLTGIHLSSYGVDLCKEIHPKSFVELEGRPLLELIGEVAKINGLERIRLGSLEPRIITDGFVESLSLVPKVCPHFHLSLQSGCAKTLRNMNRKYTPEEYLAACNIIRKYYDRPAITTDIIVGFPGETDEDFNECLEFAKTVRFSDMHVFKYSKRDGTRAAVMPDQVPESIKNERSRMLIECGKKLTSDYISLFLNEEHKVLVEERILIDEKPFFTGHNERYVKIIFPDKGSVALENTIVSVMPERLGYDNMLEGVLVRQC